MKNYFVVVSIFFAFSVANTLAYGSFENQNTCEIRTLFHENLADIVTDDVGMSVINELRISLENICTDPAAHNAIINVLDGIIDMTTDPNAAEALGATFFWIRKLIKQKNFQDIWYETVKGLNMWFDNEEFGQPITMTIFDKVIDLLNDPNFDATFEEVFWNMMNMLNFGKNMFYNAAGGALMGKKPNIGESLRRTSSFSSNRR